MKYQKLAKQLNDALCSATKDHHKHQEKVKYFLGLFKNEEQSLLDKLKQENCKADRKKLERELDTVHRAYALLGA